MRIDNERLYSLYNMLKYTDFSYYLEEWFYLSEEFFRCSDEFYFFNTDDINSSFVDASYNIVSRYQNEYLGVVNVIRNEYLPSENLSDEDILIIVATNLSMCLKNKLDIYFLDFPNETLIDDGDFEDDGFCELDNSNEEEFDLEYMLLNKSVEVCCDKNKLFKIRKISF